MADGLDKAWSLSASLSALLRKRDEQALQALLPTDSSTPVQPDKKIYSRGQVLIDTATGKFVQFYCYVMDNPEFVAEIIYIDGGKDSGLFRKSSRRYLVRPFEMERFKVVGAAVGNDSISTTGAIQTVGGTARVGGVMFGGDSSLPPVAVAGSIYTDNESGQTLISNGSRWVVYQVSSGFAGENAYGVTIPFGAELKSTVPEAKPDPAPLPTKRERKFNLDD